MTDITMSVEDTLELDAIVQNWNAKSDSTITVTDGSDYDLSGIQTKTGIFDPQSAGSYTIEVNGQQISVSVKDKNTIPESGISQEEDGSLPEYSGNTSYFDTTTSKTINGSSYAISFSNNSTPQYVEASYEDAEYNQFSMYVYPENTNNELLLVDSRNGNVVFGIFFRSEGSQKQGIFYSGSNSTQGSVSNNGTTSRISGTELVSGSNVSAQYYHIKIYNIDWANETLDIDVNDSTAVTGEPFILRGVPNTIQINSNSGNFSSTGGYIDKVDTSE